MISNQVSVQIKLNALPIVTKLATKVGQGRLLHISNEAACFIRKLGGLKNDVVFDSWGNIMPELYNDKSMQHVYFAFV